MADEIENDDQWLYGDNPDGGVTPPDSGEDEDEPANLAPETGENEQEKFPQEEPDKETSPEPEEVLKEVIEDEGPPGVDRDEPSELDQDEEPNNIEGETEDGELIAKQNGDEEEDLDDDSEDDDDVNVVIGDIKQNTSYSSQPQHSIKRGLTAPIGAADKSKQLQQTGKFQVEEFDQVGTINGVAACDFNLDSLEDKPWRKPGADITDYFNYGFNEDTWKAYCERQKRIRISESGVGVMPLNSIGLPRGSMGMNDGMKYGSGYMPGVQRPMVTQVMKSDIPKMNTIQVMTADRREYSRKPGFPDMSMPPPMNYQEPAFVPPPEYGSFNPEPEPFYGTGYEPTQDSQWMDGHGNPHWQPNEIKTLTGNSPPRAMIGGGHSRRSPTTRRSTSRERERDSRARSIRPREHDREKSRRRERSRSRSRRHKSRSRSPSHRSHKKKKSRRHEDSD